MTSFAAAQREGGGQSTWAAWRRIAGRFAPYRWLLLASAVLILVAVALTMLVPLLLLHVINELAHHETRLLALLCSGMIVAGILASVLMVAMTALTNSVGQRVVHGLRLDVYDRLQGMPLAFFAAEPNSEIQARMASDIGGISDVVTFTSQGMLSAAASLLAACLVMLILSWPLALVSLALAAALNVLNQRFNTRRRDLATQRQDRVSALLALVGEHLTLSGVILGRTMQRSADQRSRFEDVSQQIGDLTYQQRLAGSTARALIGMALACLPPTIYLLAGTMIPGLSIGTVVVLAAMQTRLSGPIQQLLSLSGTAQSSMAMFERVFAYLDMEPVLPPATSARPRLEPARPVSMRVSGVSHRYESSGRMTLADVSLDFPAGSTTLIAGPTGSSKTTLALILAGLLAPSAGNVEVDGRPVSGRELWPHVTLLAQETAIFNATVRENLLFARPDATEAQLREVIAAAQLSHLIAALPQALDTTVGDNGHQLSGGERQRLALAQAMLAPGSVLITDEATSALDSETADAVYQALREFCRGQTLVMIAHRIPALYPSDQVVVLAGGRVTECGSYRQLSTRPPSPARQPIQRGRQPR
jgi:ATP-binding cassette subfamily B protein